MRIAAIDLGSTSFHVVVVDVARGGSMTRVLRRREVLHLGAIVVKEGHLSGEAARASVRAARMLRRAADGTEPDIVVAAATHALREATNGAHLLEQLEVATRCPIRLLDGSEEARLVYEGIRATLPLGDGPALVCDLGGGSLELAVGSSGEVLWQTSFPLGASRLTASMITTDPVSPDEADAVCEHVRQTIAPAVALQKRRYPFVPCVGTGGTLRAIARMEIARKKASSDGVNGLTLPAARLNALTKRLLRTPRHKRLDLPGMPSRRVDVLPVGALVLATLCDELDLAGITVSEGGLREGLILEAAASSRAAAAG
jgi:exopolyphosphatase/guanosine-5'-triphosphate,3'-diphosphate pyrophosphatase